jgi:hypothetical protein
MHTVFYLKTRRKRPLVRLDLSGSVSGPVMGSYEHGSEPTVSIKGRKFLG